MAQEDVGAAEQVESIQLRVAERNGQRIGRFDVSNKMSQLASGYELILAGGELHRANRVVGLAIRIGVFEERGQAKARGPLAEELVAVGRGERDRGGRGGDVLRVLAVLAIEGRSLLIDLLGAVAVGKR